MRRCSSSLIVATVAFLAIAAPRFAGTQTDSLAAVQLYPGQNVYIGHLTFGPVPGAPFEDPVFRPCDREQRFWVQQTFESLELLASFYEKEGLSRDSEVFVVFSAYETDDFLRVPSPIYVGGLKLVRLLAVSASVSEQRCG